MLFSGCGVTNALGKPQRAGFSLVRAGRCRPESRSRASAAHGKNARRVRHHLGDPSLDVLRRQPSCPARSAKASRGPSRRAAPCGPSRSTRDGVPRRGRAARTSAQQTIRGRRPEGCTSRRHDRACHENLMCRGRLECPDIVDTPPPDISPAPPPDIPPQPLPERPEPQRDVPGRDRARARARASAARPCRPGGRRAARRSAVPRACCRTES